jgi:Zn-finger nucleic acid-binding protein
MKCPLDSTRLEEIAEKDLSYHQCPSCKGMWMRERALRTMIERIDPDAVIALPQPTDHPSKKMDAGNAIKCPHDGLRVHRHKLGTVMVDICPACSGIWLGPGEFEAVMEEVSKHEIPGVIGKPVAHLLAHLVHFHWADRQTE